MLGQQGSRARRAGLPLCGMGGGPAQLGASRWVQISGRSNRLHRLSIRQASRRPEGRASLCGGCLALPRALEPKQQGDPLDGWQVRCARRSQQPTAAAAAARQCCPARTSRLAAGGAAAMAQALSLKCDICGVQLRSVKEAQDHGDATGHAAFSESTEAVGGRGGWLLLLGLAATFVKQAQKAFQM